MKEILNKKEKYDFNDLLKVMAILRGENGCPWDREQTHESIKLYTIEEAYELLEAINNKDQENMIEELGDLLLHVVFHAQMGKDANTFGIEDVTDAIVTKLIRRHPHVFADHDAKSTEEVLTNWDEIKKKEKSHVLLSETMDGIAMSLPSTIRAEKVQKKAAKVGFDFANWEETFDKVTEELGEFKEAALSGDSREIEQEFGDILFSLVNLSRFFKLNTENCLTNSTEKFINRFKGIEKLAASKGKSLDVLTVEEMDELWKMVKETE